MSGIYVSVLERTVRIRVRREGCIAVKGVGDKGGMNRFEREKHPYVGDFLYFCLKYSDSHGKGKIHSFRLGDEADAS